MALARISHRTVAVIAVDGAGVGEQPVSRGPVCWVCFGTRGMGRGLRLADGSLLAMRCLGRQRAVAPSKT